MLAAAREHDTKLELFEQLRHADRLATVGRLASGIAHELGTPLNVISGYSKLIASGQEDGDAARDAAQAAFDELLTEAIALGGTVTGEHGVGLLKRDGMLRELGPGAVAMQTAVRQALDPRQIFNPGKG